MLMGEAYNFNLYNSNYYRSSSERRFVIGALLSSFALIIASYSF